MKRLKSFSVFIFACLVIAAAWLGSNEMQGLNQPWERGASTPTAVCHTEATKCATPISIIP